MKVHTPAKDTKLFSSHKDFDDVFLGHDKTLKKSFPPLKNDYLYQVQAIGEFEGDIKWNDSALVLSWSIPEKYYESPNHYGICSLASVELIRFTGNCGTKAISHFRVHPVFKEQTGKILHFIEAFAWHKLNCGLLLGSDTIYGQTYKDIQKYGDGYIFSKSTWNPNYTWDKKHEVLLYYKDLNKTKYEDFFTLVK